MAKLTSLGTFKTSLGDWFIFPCGCLPDKQAEAFTDHRHPATPDIQLNGKRKRPVWTNFSRVDYIYIEKQQEVEVED